MAKYKIPNIKEMLDAGVHFGHQVKRWHPKMEPYIYMVSKNVHIIDLEQTEKMLSNACDFLFEQAKLGKSIIFVGTKKQSKEIIENEAKRCGASYVNDRWIGGSITNFPTIKKNIDKLISFVSGLQDGSFDKYTKKERLLIEREVEKMQKSYGGIVSLTKVPNVLFVIDPKREKTAVREAASAKVPVVAITDTNADPTVVDYAIPGNDDAIKSVALLVKTIADSVEAGYQEYSKELERVKNKVEEDKLAVKEEKPEVKEEPKKEVEKEKVEKKETKSIDKVIKDKKPAAKVKKVAKKS